MKKILFYLLVSNLLLTAMTASTGCGGSESRHSPNVIPDYYPGSEINRNVEEYAVYNVLIDHILENYYLSDIQMVVIEDHTKSEGLIGGDDLFAIDREVIDDFYYKNTDQSHPLSEDFTIELDYVFISEEELPSVELADWEEFYEKYPDSQGILTLSRVGLNVELNQAVVCMSNVYGNLGGEGYCLPFIKENGAWRVFHEAIDIFTMWIA